MSLAVSSIPAEISLKSTAATMVRRLAMGPPGSDRATAVARIAVVLEIPDCRTHAASRPFAARVCGLHTAARLRDIPARWGIARLPGRAARAANPGGVGPARHGRGPRLAGVIDGGVP